LRSIVKNPERATGFGGRLGVGTSQPARGDLIEQLDDGAVTGGVLLEHPPDQRAAFGVDLDGAVLAALARHACGR
jgi:hypothetical protein